jgi:hypothetical protein
MCCASLQQCAARTTNPFCVCGCAAKRLKTVLPAVLVPCGCVILAGLFLAFVYAKKQQSGTALVTAPGHIDTTLAPFEDVESSNPQLQAPPAAQTTLNPLHGAPPKSSPGMTVPSGADLFMPVPTFLADESGK